MNLISEEGRVSEDPASEGGLVNLNIDRGLGIPQKCFFSFNGQSNKRGGGKG